MQIYANQLSNHLNNLMPCYLIFGDEPLQKQQTIGAIRAAVAAQGFEQRVILCQEPGFSWSELYQAGQSMSLFSERQLIELELTSLKAGQEGSKALLEYMANTSPDNILLIHGPKATQDIQKSKWFKTLSQAGLFVIVNQPQGQQFNRWIATQAQTRQVNFSPDALAQFCTMFEGNLLAADQELEKLSLQVGQQLIDRDSLKQRVSNQARYNLFELQDCLLSGQTQKACAILNNLEQQSIEPQLIFWAFNREFELLKQLKHAQQQHQSLSTIYQKSRIWQSRQTMYQQALNRLTMAHFAHITKLLAEIDLQIKQHFNLPWQQVTQLTLVFCETELQRELFL
ncbi:MAG: DNA polymerase III subunit delta [Gammaproteobacteria bacterium]|nr:DNA polymerase III subunit delta [Gammaproteobacteria bacterium]